MTKDLSTMDNHLYRFEIKESLAKGAGKSIRYSSTLDTDMLYYAEKYNNMIIRLAKPLREVDESVYKTRRTILIIAMIAILAAIAATVLASRKITGPINEAINFAGDFSRGDYLKRIKGFRDDETGVLQNTLNSMADIIVEKLDGLILEQNKLKVTIESIRDGIAVIDGSKKIVIANRSFISLLEINTSAENKMYYEVIRNRTLNTKIENCLISGKPDKFEERLSGVRTCEVYINAITDEHVIKGMLVVLHD
ncbi:MAG: PAS domain-containing protein, partial [Spirochaetes bacterium]|nr:PAS domain-containing protein [Spirochaetota bacterium]